MEHVHSEVRELASHVGMTLAMRHTWRRPIWDGETLGLFFYNRHVKQFMPLTDHDILHEICHYMLAEECQRDLPEYGLGYVSAFHGSQTYNPNVVDDFGYESEAQEMATWILACMLGPSMGISPLLGEQRKGVFSSSSCGWNAYFRYSLSEIQEYEKFKITLEDVQERAFKALREFGL